MHKTLSNVTAGLMPILQQCWELARVKTSGHSRPIMLQCVSLLPSIHSSWPTKRPIVSLPENASVVLNNFPTSKYLEGWTLVRYFLEFVSPSSILDGSMHQLLFVKYKHLCIYKDFFLEQVAVRNLANFGENIQPNANGDWRKTMKQVTYIPS